MEDYMPKNFLEVVAASLLLIAAISGICSMKFSIRAHALRLLAIFCVTALAIFSNHVTTYFTAIFVIATAVTELDFLQNLAAIIRGNKEFFDYQKSVLPKQSRMSNLAHEVEETAAVAETEPDPMSSCTKPVPADDDLSERENSDFSSEDTVTNDGAPTNSTSSGSHYKPDQTLEEPPQSPQPPQESGKGTEVASDKPLPSRVAKVDIDRVYYLEALALNRLQLDEGEAIEKGVRYYNETASVELDGVTRRKSRIDTVYEVKYISSSLNFIRFARILNVRLSEKVVNYKLITGRTAWIHLVIVLENGVHLTKRQQASLSFVGVDSVSIFRAEELLKS